MLWLEIFGNDISLKELKGLYQLKKPVDLSIAYFSSRATYGTLMEVGSILMKGYKYGRFGADGDWGQDILVDNEHLSVRSSFNKGSMCPLFFFFSSISHLRLLVTL